MNRIYRWLVVTPAIVLPSFGCVSPETESPLSSLPTLSKSSPAAAHKSHAPTGVPQQVHALWENRVVTTQDSVNGGRPLPCLAGRLYLFGEETGHPFKANGSLMVDAHEILPDGKTKMIERWEIDPVTLQKLFFKDHIGWGYTLFLPWQTFRPDIQRVQLQAKFVPETGVPLFSPPSNVSLRQDRAPTVTTNIIPTAGEKQ